MKLPVVIRYEADWDEYTVPHPDGRQASEYYTSDKEDAIDTCRVMWETTSNVGVYDGLNIIVMHVDEEGVHKEVIEE